MNISTKVLVNSLKQLAVAGKYKDSIEIMDAAAERLDALRKRELYLKLILKDALEYVRVEPIYREQLEGPNERLRREATKLMDQIKRELKIN